jgi:lipopolysaccharide export system permease protein
MQARPSVNRIDSYIVGQLAVALLLVTAGLVAFIWLTQSLRFIQIIVDHGLSPFVFLRLTSLLLPSFVATILPIACFIVVLSTYLRLAGDRELTIMRGFGLSDVSLARPAIFVALVAVGLGYGLTLDLVPATLSAFHDYQFEIRDQIAAFLLEPGVFTPVSTDVTVYVQGRAPDDTLSGIIIEDNRDKTAPATILARTGQLEVTPQGPVVVLQDGSREQIDRATGQLALLSFKSNTLSLVQARTPMEPDAGNDATLPLAQLVHPQAGVVAGQRGKFLVEAQRRLTAPLSALSYTLVALVAVLGGSFQRHGGLLRPFIAVAVITALVALDLAVDNMAARHLDLLSLIWVAALLPLLVAGGLLLGQKAPRA